MHRAGLVAALAASASASALATTAAAAPVPRSIVALPSPTSPLSVLPPLQGGRLPIRVYRGQLTSDERIRIGVDGTGVPKTLEVEQRLVAHGLGDYYLVVPAPVTDVEPTPDSESRPGLQQAAIIWQGFSPGRRLLGARAVVDLGRSRGALPLRIRVSTRAGGAPLSQGRRITGRLGFSLVVTDATVAMFRGSGGRADALEIARALDQFRKAQAGRPPPGATIGIRGRVRQLALHIRARFLVTGHIDFAGPPLRDLRVRGAEVQRRRGGTSLRFRALLGDGRPDLRITATASADGVAAPKLDLRATPLTPERILRPPGAPTWVAAVRAQPSLQDGAALLRRAYVLLAQSGRTHQYATLILSPDPQNAATATYRYTTVAVMPPALRPQRPGSTGLGTLAAVAIGLAAALGAAGLAVVWAHS